MGSGTKHGTYLAEIARPGEAGDRDRRRASELCSASPRVHSPVFFFFFFFFKGGIMLSTNL